MEEYYSIVYTYHIFFIRSSVNRHIGRFHALAIVNDAVVNVGLLISFKAVFLFPSDKFPEVKFLEFPQKTKNGSYGTSIFKFLRKLHTVLHSSYTNLMPANSVQRFPFLHILTNTCYFLSFNHSHLPDVR